MLAVLFELLERSLLINEKPHLTRDRHIDSKADGIHQILNFYQLIFKAASYCAELARYKEGASDSGSSECLTEFVSKMHHF